MIGSEPRSSPQPVVPPRVPPHTSPRTLAPSSPRSINTSSSSYNDVFDPPPLPPKVPSSSSSPTQPPLPTRAFSPPPLSPSSINTPPRSPPVPLRTNLSDSGRSNSLEREMIPRSNSEGAHFKRSAFQTPNPHEDAIRRKSSIEDLNRRTEQLSLQRNQVRLEEMRSISLSKLKWA